MLASISKTFAENIANLGKRIDSWGEHVKQEAQATVNNTQYMRSPLSPNHYADGEKRDLKRLQELYTKHLFPVCQLEMMTTVLNVEVESSAPVHTAKNNGRKQTGSMFYAETEASRQLLARYQQARSGRTFGVHDNDPVTVLIHLVTEWLDKIEGMSSDDKLHLEEVAQYAAALKAYLQAICADHEICTNEINMGDASLKVVLANIAQGCEAVTQIAYYKLDDIHAKQQLAAVTQQGREFTTSVLSFLFYVANNDTKANYIPKSATCDNSSNQQASKRGRMFGLLESSHIVRAVLGQQHARPGNMAGMLPGVVVANTDTGLTSNTGTYLVAFRGVSKQEQEVLSGIIDGLEAKQLFVEKLVRAHAGLHCFCRLLSMVSALERMAGIGGDVVVYLIGGEVTSAVLKALLKVSSELRQLLNEICVEVDGIYQSNLKSSVVPKWLGNLNKAQEAIANIGKAAAGMQSNIQQIYDKMSASSKRLTEQMLIREAQELLSSWHDIQGETQSFLGPAITPPPGFTGGIPPALPWASANVQDDNKGAIAKAAPQQTAGIRKEPQTKSMEAKMRANTQQTAQQQAISTAERDELLQKRAQYISMGKGEGSDEVLSIDTQLKRLGWGDHIPNNTAMSSYSSFSSNNSSNLQTPAEEMAGLRKRIRQYKREIIDLEEESENNPNDEGIKSKISKRKNWIQDCEESIREIEGASKHKSSEDSKQYEKIGSNSDAKFKAVNNTPNSANASSSGQNATNSRNSSATTNTTTTSTNSSSSSTSGAAVKGDNSESDVLNELGQEHANKIVQSVKSGELERARSRQLDNQGKLYFGGVGGTMALAATATLVGLEVATFCGASVTIFGTSVAGVGTALSTALVPYAAAVLGVAAPASLPAGTVLAVGCVASAGIGILVFAGVGLSAYFIHKNRDNIGKGLGYIDDFFHRKFFGGQTRAQRMFSRLANGESAARNELAKVFSDNGANEGAEWLAYSAQYFAMDLTPQIKKVVERLQHDDMHNLRAKCITTLCEIGKESMSVAQEYRKDFDEAVRQEVVRRCSKSIDEELNNKAYDNMERAEYIVAQSKILLGRLSVILGHGQLPNEKQGVPSKSAASDITRCNELIRQGAPSTVMYNKAVLCMFAGTLLEEGLRMLRTTENDAQVTVDEGTLIHTARKTGLGLSAVQQEQGQSKNS